MSDDKFYLFSLKRKNRLCTQFFYNDESPFVYISIYSIIYIMKSIVTFSLIGILNFHHQFYSKNMPSQRYSFKLKRTMHENEKNVKYNNYNSQ